jgi:hypothetical protein
MRYEYEYAHEARTGWAICLQAAILAGISTSALRQAIMIHHARQKTALEATRAWDPWQEWSYCLHSIGLPESEINRVKQLYFRMLIHQTQGAQLHGLD